MHTHSCLCANKYVFFLHPQKEASPGIVCIWGGVLRLQETGKERDRGGAFFPSFGEITQTQGCAEEGEEADSYTHLLIRNLLEDKVIQQGQLLSYLQG